MEFTKKKLRKLNADWHRDLGYFFSSLILIYCISGIALNHVNDWNADFILTKKDVKLEKSYSIGEISTKEIDSFNKLVGQESYKVYDFPTPDQVKIYYDNSSLHVYFTEQRAVYEDVQKRPLFYQVNVLHRNSLEGWKWASDIFAFFLIVINVTGLFIAKGKHGLSGRGKWFIAAGFIPPIVAIIIQALI